MHIECRMLPQQTVTICHVLRVKPHASLCGELSQPKWQNKGLHSRKVSSTTLGMTSFRASQLTCRAGFTLISINHTCTQMARHIRQSDTPATQSDTQSDQTHQPLSQTQKPLSQIRHTSHSDQTHQALRHIRHSVRHTRHSVRHIRHSVRHTPGTQSDTLDTQTHQALSQKH